MHFFDGNVVIITTFTQKSNVFSHDASTHSQQANFTLTRLIFQPTPQSKPITKNQNQPCPTSPPSKPRSATSTLYTEAIDLRALGRLQVFRATDIRFCEKSQQWNVRCASTGKRLHSDPSREACLAWERANLGPPNPEAQRPAITLPNLTP